MGRMIDFSMRRDESRSEAGILTAQYTTITRRAKESEKKHFFFNSIINANLAHLQNKFW